MKEYDFIIIGSGIAGLTTAIMASKKGTVLLLTKEYDLRSGNSFISKEGIVSNFDYNILYNDIIKASHYNADEEIALLVAKNAQNAFNFLKNEIGVPFLDEPIAGGGHKKNRIFITGDNTGETIVNFLIKKVEKITNINYITELKVKEVITNDIKHRESRLDQIGQNKAYGIFGEKNGQDISFYGKHIVLASGGDGQKHGKTTNSLSSTGDGIEIAKKIGAEVDGMQLIKYYPLCVKGNNNPLLHLPMNLLLNGIKIVNLKGENILEKHSLLKNCTSDELSRIIFNEESSGEQCFMNFSGNEKAKLEEKFLHSILSLEIEGFDILKDKIAITPTAYFTVGGIKINSQCKTSVASLFAIGEVSFSGIYGTGNMTGLHITETVVLAKSFIDGV